METTQAELELSVIKKIMEDSRTAVYDSGIQGIFWSVLVAVTLIINYVILITRLGLEYLGYTWLVLMSLGVIVSIFIEKKEKKKIRVKTFAGRILTAVWVSIGVSNSIFAFASIIAHAYDGVYIIPLDSLVMGTGFYVTGIIQQMKFLKYLSCVWWAGGVFFLIFPGVHCILFFSLMLIISLLIPSIDNRRKWKMESDFKS